MMSDSNLLTTRRKIVVDASGAADCRTIQDAIDLVPRHNKERVVIQIRPGTYRGKVHIPRSKPNITLQGYPNATVILYDSITSGTVSGTIATVAIEARFFTAINIIFQNSAPAPPPGSEGKQSVAVRISADMAAFYHCKFLGIQDALYDHRGRHYFENCFIEGASDLIFGYGRSLDKNCILHALNNSGNPGSLTAQERDAPTMETGFSFVDCDIKGSARVNLGNYSRVVFARTYMENIILPVGWNDSGTQANERTAYLAEFNCSGPGAVTIGRAPWVRLIDDREAKQFLSSAFIDGRQWLPRDYHDLLNDAPVLPPKGDAPNSTTGEQPAVYSTGFVIGGYGYLWLSMVTVTYLLTALAV